MTIDLELTYPVGQSPKVFTTGWHFGARAIAKEDGLPEKDISDKVRWSGTGKFTPAQGAQSSPVFQGEGANTITLEVTYKGKTERNDFSVSAVSPYVYKTSSRLYAVVSDIAFCPADGHGAPGDPMAVKGPIISGSPTVSLDGLPVARLGDRGIHAACSGSNSFVIAQGDTNVLIDGLPAARIGDKTQHCGGVGRIRGATNHPDAGNTDGENHHYYELKVRLLHLYGRLKSLNDSVLYIKSELQRKVAAEKSQGDVLLEEMSAMLDQLKQSDSSQDQETPLSRLVAMSVKMQDRVDEIVRIKIHMQSLSAKV
ncbi:MAG: PAAR domain-containing protein, partial [Candidatus Omnitrophica bacterium]|nr:PAAR domain-containing protein [Candidatus Omnitrophota bacterium]